MTRVSLKMGETASKEKRVDQQLSPFELEAKRLLDIDIRKLENRSIMKGQFVGRVVDMYDGDTLKVAIHNESDKLEMLQIRVMGSDTPELKGSTSVAGRAAKNEALVYLGADGAQNLTNGAKMVNYFQENPTFVGLAFVPEREKFGRFLAHVRNPLREKTLSEHLIERGLAVPYGGGTKDQSMFENGLCACPIDQGDPVEAILSDPFKNETVEEKRIVMNILEYVKQSPLRFSSKLVALERKKIVRKIRDKKIGTAEEFLEQLFQ